MSISNENLFGNSTPKFDLSSASSIAARNDEIRQNQERVKAEADRTWSNAANQALQNQQMQPPPNHMPHHQ